MMRSLVFIFSILLSFSTEAQELDPGVEAVKSWKSLGVRLAVGYDQDQKVVGVFDLSYAMPWTRTKVGSLTSPRIKARDILKAIVSGEVENVEQDLRDRATKELSEKSEEDMDGNLLPSNWRDKVVWKAGAQAHSSTFALSDFDIQSAVNPKKLKEFNESMNYALSLINDGEDLQFLGDLLSQIQIVQNGKDFDVYFSPVVSARDISKPKKIANLRNPKLSFLEALKFELIKKAIKQATDFIVNPIVKAFVDTAISRVFHFLKVVNFSHYHMSLEVLADIADGGGSFPADVLSEEDMVHMAESLQFAQSSLNMSWKWIFKKPYKEWLSDREDQVEYSDNARKWLTDKGVNSVLVNPRFAMLNVKDLSVLSMKKHDKKKGPFVAHIDGKASPHRNSRIAKEIITTAVVFGTNFIPLVGGLLEDIYKKIVESPMNKQRYWEARLTSVLEQRQAIFGEDWSAQLASLDGQRVNPFFKKRSDIMNLIEARKKAYKIP